MLHSCLHFTQTNEWLFETGCSTVASHSKLPVFPVTWCFLLLPFFNVVFNCPGCSFNSSLPFLSFPFLLRFCCTALLPSLSRTVRTDPTAISQTLTPSSHLTPRQVAASLLGLTSPFGLSSLCCAVPCRPRLEFNLNYFMAPLSL